MCSFVVVLVEFVWWWDVYGGCMIIVVILENVLGLVFLLIFEVV